jgi:hypothetical protein
MTATRSPFHSIVMRQRAARRARTHSEIQGASPVYSCGAFPKPLLLVPLHILQRSNGTRRPGGRPLTPLRVPLIAFAQAGATFCAGVLHPCEVGWENAPPQCLTLLHFGRVPRFPRRDLHFARARSSPGAVPSKLLKVNSREGLPTRGSSSAPPIDPFLLFPCPGFYLPVRGTSTEFIARRRFKYGFWKVGRAPSQFLGRRYAGRVPPESGTQSYSWPHFGCPYNARLTREAVAPFQPAWKGRMKGGSGAAFAVRPTPRPTRAKGVTATLSRC